MALHCSVDNIKISVFIGGVGMAVLEGHVMVPTAMYTNVQRLLLSDRAGEDQL